MYTTDTAFLQQAVTSHGKEAYHLIFSLLSEGLSSIDQMEIRFINLLTLLRAFNLLTNFLSLRPYGRDVTMTGKILFSKL